MKEQTLSGKEARRVFVMEQLVKGVLTVNQAAEHLSLSSRQVLRLKAGMQQNGTAALAHAARGRPSARSTPAADREVIVALAMSDYKGANLTHFAELLAQNQQIAVSAKTVGRILKDAGVPRSKKRRSRRGKHPHRSRARAAREGMLVQADATPYDWLEGRDPRYAMISLHGAIDDATGNIVGLYFRPTEDTVGYLNVCWQVFTRHGLPLAFYTDRHTLFFSPDEDKLSIEEQLAGKTVALTQFGRMLEELSVQHKKAYSPQAKGRVERLWETLQDRLVIEMRLAGINTLEEANAFLPVFLVRFNSSYAVMAAESESVWRPAPRAPVLCTIVCQKHTRSASHGSTIQFLGGTYQLVQMGNAGGGASGLPIAAALTPRKAVTVLEHLDGTRTALYAGQQYALRELPRPLRGVRPSKELSQAQRTVEPDEPHDHPAARTSASLAAERRIVQPSANHPWRRGPACTPKSTTAPVPHRAGSPTGQYAGNPPG